ncbi:Late embryogenesis abundant protein [Datura stramonium]|uniref:Late embryogenesis abundant protein n=1 Tax=Datura stramonium TaxID=4076 RepID=A0ABS8RWS8_DATST|nr:Late embryogenesis abundant protein [Datura stramonium]
MTVRNPNKRIGIYYDSIEARAMYQGQRFDSQILETFYQGHKNTSTLHPVFKGQSIVLLGDREKSNYNNEKNSGVYEMEVKLYMRIRLKIGWIKTHKIKPKIECDFKGHKNTSTLHPVFKGQSIVLLGDREKSNYNNQKNSGVYEIEVKLYMRIRLKAGWIKTHKIKPKIECDFKVPLESNGRSANFEETRCHLDW